MARPQQHGAPGRASHHPLLPQAMAAFQQGRSADCATLCEKILATRKKDTDALHLLGVSRLRLGDARGAVEALSRAVQIDARNPELHANLGAALRTAGEIGKARATLERALALKPDHVPALINLANVASDTGDYDAAATQYRRALVLSPAHPGALANLGRALAGAGDFAGGEEAYRSALAAAPGHPDALRGLARLYREACRWEKGLVAYDAAIAALPGEAALHNERGIVLLKLDRPEDAEAAFRVALETDPDCTDARINLGSALCLAGRATDGVAVLEQALAAGSDDADTLSNLGAAFSDAGLNDRATAALQQALAKDANHADAMHNLGRIHQEAGRLDDAIALYDRAIAAAPNHADARCTRATANLSTRRFTQGWADYLCRPSTKDLHRFYRSPLPDRMDGQHVLVERDQGLGDEIFFLRFLPALRARGARVTYIPSPRLAAMLQRAGLADRVLGTGETADRTDLHVSVGDLPYLLGYGDEDPLPPSIRLMPLPERVDALRARLATFGPPPWVGLTWRAGTTGQRQALSKEAPEIVLARTLAGACGRAATWIALQRLPIEGEMEAIAAALNAPLHDMTEANSDLEEVLARVSVLDDYICVSNTNLHFRAACGGSCRVLVPHPPEFRWTTAAGPSPWFPDMPTYRQRIDGSWDDALATLAVDLAAS